MARNDNAAAWLSIWLRHGARPVSTSGSDSSTVPGWSSSGVTISDRLRSRMSPK
jgi:hypothetical protein